MDNVEGVIQFDLRFTPGEPMPVDALREIMAWRRILWLMGLIGHDPNRYDGYGYGNISILQPSAESPDCFIISGSQTGEIAHLNPEGYAAVEDYDLDQNRIMATGPLNPSSEALTHAAIYRIDPEIKAVIHAHSPEIWGWGMARGLPATPADAACGTPEMAAAAAAVYPGARTGRILIMAGHEDGVLTFGKSLAEAGTRMVQAMAKALAA